MSEKKTAPDGSAVDMQNPESIRAYVRHQLLMVAEPSVAGLKRLEMLLEVADSLPQPDKQAGAVVKLVDAKAAAEELQRRLANK